MTVFYAWQLKKTEPHGSLKTAPHLCISADTVVVLNGRILGKPESPEAAAHMPAQLSGNIHQVLTAVCASFGTHTQL